MQQFQIPQFIEMEDKLFGPLTFKQFLYLVGGGGICFIIYVWVPLPFIIQIIPIAGVAALALALAFVKYNGRPFIVVLEAFIKYSLGNKLYIWKKDEKRVQKNPTPTQTLTNQNTDLKLPRLSESKLNELAWSLDVKKPHNPEE
ncbi:MAG TPA: PrgI family protein [Candidatus Paceibacterota bacterium]|jgi:hypothetical protein|nr:PrgI family protein [Candidatus Paceibacterota bacterium]HOH11186.1 PrgI family protein [Candidatus Paceibacterota bacterium]HPB60607.1 PrgI family protein [Candidatus Paceibacterota bacterium]HPV33576.1 PrgI family protein [Candidatus Paceibacterota bacterium]HPY12883.1 PrgI family protein [Candidatus Paceibacterota bacterium]